VQETGKKHFLGWDEGPESNADGPLQCGTIAQNVPVKKRETCISGELHGVSWTEPGADGNDSNDFDMDDGDDNGDGDKVKRQANDDPIWKCVGSKPPYGVFINGKVCSTSLKRMYDVDLLTVTAVLPGREHRCGGQGRADGGGYERCGTTGYGQVSVCT
jgi:hypothetical protein